MSLLDKGLNFCPSTKDVNNEELLDDTFAYCRKLRLKYHFNKPVEETGDEQSNEQSNEEINEPSINDERCPMKTTFKNPYFDPPSNHTPPNLEKYIAATKSSISKVFKIPGKSESNLSPSECKNVGFVEEAERYCHHERR